MSLQWTRSVKGSLAAGPALSFRGYLALNAQTPAGCSLMEWENNDNGRQRWCVRLFQGGGFAGPLFDGFDNLYVGQPGAILSFPTTQWTRWREPVIGMPSTPRFLGDGQLLVSTHLGQVLVFDAHRGEVVGSPLDLVDGVDPTDATRGLADCAPARPGCPVAAAPAFSAASGTVVLGVWQPGAPAAGLVGLKYHPGQTPLLAREWTSDAVGDGVIASPVLSADGSTVYVNGRDQRLWALHAADGKVKWSVPLGFLAQTPPAVTPQGLIVSGGGPDTRLVAFKDAGDHAEQAWRRDDVTPLSATSLAGGARRLHGGLRSGRRRRTRHVRYWCSIRPTATRSTAIRCPRPPDIPSGCRSATIDGWSPPPATARCTASRPRERCESHELSQPGQPKRSPRWTSPQPFSCWWYTHSWSARRWRCWGCSSWSPTRAAPGTAATRPGSTAPWCPGLVAAAPSSSPPSLSP